MIEPDPPTTDSTPATQWGEVVPASRPTPIPMAIRIAIFGFGIVVPIVCHLLTLNHPPSPPEWQSGALRHKLGYLLSGRCGWPMFPLLGFAMFCLGMVTIVEKQAAKGWVRFGVFTGVLVTVWYLFAFSLSFGGVFLGPIGLLLGAGIFLLVIYGIYLACTIIKNNEDKGIVALVFLFGGIILVSSFVWGFEGLTALFIIPFFVSLILSTPLAFLVYLGMSIRIIRIYREDLRYSIAELMGAVTWLAMFFAAIRATITNSLAEYAQLPLEPPEGCYIATAAANGHPAIVGSHRLSAVMGQPVFVNQQLTTFKAAELVLRAISPGSHRAFRFVYNRIGPPLAAMLGSRLLASLAYLSLKPAEWLCWLTLRILLGRDNLHRTINLYLDRAAAALARQSQKQTPSEQTHA